MSTSIGQVNIDLRMNLAQFSQDTKQGTRDASRATKQMADEMKANSREATGSLALLGEEFGINIPRHLRTVIATLPGVGEALNAAFSSVAVLALLSVIVELAKKLSEFRQKTEEVAKAWDGVSRAGQDSMRKLEEEGLALQKQIDELRGDHLAALRDELQLLDDTTLDRVEAEFVKLGKAADAAFKKMEVSGFANFFGLGNNQAVETAKKDLEEVVNKVNELRNSGDNDGIGKLLDSKISLLKSLKDVTVENDRILKSVSKP